MTFAASEAMEQMKILCDSSRGSKCQCSSAEPRGVSAPVGCFFRGGVPSFSLSAKKAFFLL